MFSHLALDAFKSMASLKDHVFSRELGTVHSEVSLGWMTTQFGGNGRSDRGGEWVGVLIFVGCQT